MSAAAGCVRSWSPALASGAIAARTSRRCSTLVSGHGRPTAPIPKALMSAIGSSICLIENGRFYYRGQDAVRLSERATLEDIARLLWLDEAASELCRSGQTRPIGKCGVDLRSDRALPNQARRARRRGSGGARSDAVAGDPHRLADPSRAHRLRRSDIACARTDPPAARRCVAVGRGGRRPYPPLPRAARRSRAQRIDLCRALRRLDRCDPLRRGHGGVERIIRRPPRRRDRARRRLAPRAPGGRRSDGGDGRPAGARRAAAGLWPAALSRG